MQLSLFSVGYAGFWGQERLDTVAFIRKAAELGFQAIMLAGKRPHLSPLDADTGRLEAVRLALSETGVRCRVLAAYTDFGGRVAAEVPFMEMQLAYVETLSRLARDVGGDIVRVFTAYEVPGQSPHTTWQNVVTCLREASDRAAAYGITLAVQNHHDIGVESRALLELLHDVDRSNCRLGCDAWSPALRGEALYDAARELAPFTVLTTNADYVRFARFRYQPDLVNYDRATPDLVRAVPFGTGFIDYEAFFSGLRDGGFNGVATYEMCSPIRGGGALSNLDAYSRGYVEWMRQRGFADDARQA